MQKLLADNEQINVIIGEQQTLNVVIESNKVVSVGEGALEENTLDVLVTEGALSQLSTTQDIGTTFKELLDNKEIQFKPKGFFKKMKFGIAQWIAGFFL